MRTSVAAPGVVRWISRLALAAAVSAVAVGKKPPRLRKRKFKK